MAKNSVLFVCLGNICRSPMAEAVFLSILKQRDIVANWKVDSAATCDYHVGGSPDDRTMKVLQKHGITDYKHVVRMVVEDDFKHFSYILGMDDSNVSYLTELAQQLPSSKAVIRLLGSYDDSNKEKTIPDPYYTRGFDCFENVYELCLKACDGFLRHAER